MTGLPEFPTLGCCMCSAAHMSPHNVRIKGKPWEPLVNHRRPAPAAQKHVHLFAAKACQCHDIHAACAHFRHGSKLWTCIAQVAPCTNSGHASCDRCCHQLSLAFPFRHAVLTPRAFPAGGHGHSPRSLPAGYGHARPGSPSGGACRRSVAVDRGPPAEHHRLCPLLS